MVYRCHLDAQRTLLFASDGCLELTGYPATVLVANSPLTFADLIQESDRRGVFEELATAVQEARPYRCIYRITTAADEQRWVLDKGRASTQPDGTVVMEGFVTTTYPNAHVLLLTSFSEDDPVFTAVKASAMGYLLQESSFQELRQAIRHVPDGRASLQPDSTLKVIPELNKPSARLPVSAEQLTDREIEVLKLVAHGLTNQDIANQLVVSERTVRTHLSNILGKLRLANRTQAALYALRQGLATLDE